MHDQLRAMIVLRHILSGFTLTFVVFGSSLMQSPLQQPTVKLQEVLRIGEEANFIRIEEISCDDNGDIFVTDSYQYAVKQFSSRGRLKREFGKRGNGDKEFLGVPYKIIHSGEMVGIAEKGLSRIRFYLPGFKIVKSISAPGVIVDAICDARGRVCVNLIPFSRKTDDLLVVMDDAGAITSRVPLTDVRREPALNMVHLGVNSRNVLVVAHRFVNMITLYNESGTIRRSFGIRGLPPQSPMRPSKISEIDALPEGDLIADLGIDKRNDYYFLLGGEYSMHPNRDVYIFDNEGTALCTITLPEKSGLVYIDDAGYLYTRENERSILKKYRIVYNNMK